MAPCWQPTVVVATRSDGRHMPAIDLEIESQIPSELRYSFHNYATRWMTRLPRIAG
jgi:hypothetical protein